MNPFDVFQTALELPSIPEQDAFIEEACRDDSALAANVRSLIEAHRMAGDFLESPVLSNDLSDRASDTVVPDALDVVFHERELRRLLPRAQDPSAYGMLGDFSILEILGAGTSGVVVKAMDEKLRRLVAIKMLRPTHDSDVVDRERENLLAEASTVASIQHDSVVKVHMVQEAPIPYIVMELVEGTDLDDFLKKIGPLPMPQLIDLGKQIIAGMAACHVKGIWHCDIKPANILLEQKDQLRIKLTDFGIAQAMDRFSADSERGSAFTPAYSSPEQAQGNALDYRSDQFSLGCVLFHMACGEPPFPGATVSEVLHRIAHEAPLSIRSSRPDLPEWFCKCIDRLLAKSPSDRYESSDDLAREWAIATRSTNRSIGNKFQPLSTAAAILLSVLAIAMCVTVWSQRQTGIPGPGIVDTVVEELESTEKDRSALHASRRTLLELPPWPDNRTPAPIGTPTEPARAHELQKEWALHLGEDLISKTSTGIDFALIPPGDFDRTYTRT
jgi:eukaryotic-like serine/threonine-protein kinase